MSDKLLIFIVYLIRHHERRTNTESIRNSYILFLHKYPSYVCEAYPRLTVSRTYGHVFIGTQLRNAIPAETYTPALPSTRWLRIGASFLRYPLSYRLYL